MAERYYRKDWVEAEQREDGSWVVSRYDIQSDKWAESFLIPQEVFKEIFIKDDSGDQQQAEETPGARGQVAVAYAVTVDGFIEIKPKAIRNPKSPFIIWMSRAVWARLANCATREGQFYIPRTDTIDSPAVLRALVEAA